MEKNQFILCVSGSRLIKTDYFVWNWNVAHRPTNGRMGRSERDLAEWSTDRILSQLRTHLHAQLAATRRIEMARWCDMLCQIQPQLGLCRSRWKSNPVYPAIKNRIVIRSVALTRFACAPNSSLWEQTTFFGFCFVHKYCGNGGGRSSGYSWNAQAANNASLLWLLNHKELIRYRCLIRSPILLTDLLARLYIVRSLRSQNSPSTLEISVRNDTCVRIDHAETVSDGNLWWAWAHAAICCRNVPNENIAGTEFHQPIIIIP